MDTTLFAFIIALCIVIGVCTIVAFVRQAIINKHTKTNTVSGSANHIMDTDKYSGKYTICKKIGEANAEF